MGMYKLSETNQVSESEVEFREITKDTVREICKSIGVKGTVRVCSAQCSVNRGSIFLRERMVSSNLLWGKTCGFCYAGGLPRKA